MVISKEQFRVRLKELLSENLTIEVNQESSKFYSARHLCISVKFDGEIITSDIFEAAEDDIY